MKTLTGLKTFVAAALVALALAPQARAEVVFSEHVPFETVTENPCTGELILITGQAHFVVTQTIDQGGGIHTVSHVDASNVRGVGLDTGIEYRGARAANIVLNNAVERPGALDFTEVSTFQLVAPGPDNNLWVRTLYHVTVSDTGRFAEVLQFEIECR